jgi:uncharacterized protein (TIGR03083 family)
MAGVHLDAYLELRVRVAELVLSGAPETVVPACPGWRVRDVVAHLAGLCEDWVDHRLDGYGSDGWTGGQVSRFSDCEVPQILERWAESANRFALLHDDRVMGPPSRWAFGDAVVHEADLRGALRSGRVPESAILLSMKGSIARWREHLGMSTAPSLLVRTSDARDWWIGPRDAPGAVEVQAPLYELFRALSGRRSTSQIRAWSWSEDPEPFIVAGLPYPFHWATATIED